MNKYWSLRQRDAIFNRELSVAEAKLADQYIRCFDTTLKQISSLYDELLAGKVHNREILVSDLYKFNRYFDLLNSLNANLSKLGNSEIPIYNDTLISMYKSTSELITTELGKSNFNPIVDENTIKNTINAIWCDDGKRWSDRIWSNKALLQDRLLDGLVDCVARGASKDDLINSIRSSFQVGYNNADRIARTELNYVQNQATLNRYVEYGIEKYQILTTSDDRTCSEQCEELEGHIYYLKDAEVGENYPPFHPNCRCTVLAVLDE